MKHFQHLTFFFIIVIVLSKYQLTNSSSFQEHLSNTKKQLDLTIPDGAKIFFQSWGKYFYSTQDLAKPTEFFVNKKYSAQRYPTSVAQQADENGTLVIPDESSFFMVLYLNNLSIYASRDEILNSAIDSLLIEDITPVPEDDYLKGGLKNLGKFKPGFCVVVKTKPHAAYNADAFINKNWYFCFESNNTKTKFLKTLAKMKVIDQRSKNQIVTSQQVSEENLNDKLLGGKKKEENETKDGKMVLLQDWSECTLKCGGGKSYQQWMCIPPAKGGKPCSGQTIKEKDCNTDACPETRTADDEKKSNEENKFVKPIVKIARFSQRFNRYTKCVIKETDIFKIDAEENKIPARLIMNTQTLSIYGDDEYLNKEYSFNLAETDFKILPKFCCFELTDKARKSQFCGFDTACGDPDTNPFITDLSQKFTEFKTVCNRGKATTFISDEDIKQIKASKQKAMSVQNFEVESQKAEKAHEEITEETNTKVFKKINETQKSGLKALEKEVRIESLIKQDEEKKEGEKEVLIYKQIEQEKQKNKAINQQIKEKELETDFQMEDFQAQKDVKEAQNEIVEQIQVNRENLKKQLDEIRKEAKKRRQTLQGKLKKLKSSISQKLMKATKNGNKDQCLKGLRTDTIRIKYCDAIYVDDYLENEYCKETENFCYSCCDNEFGLLKPADRDDCYESCDSERDKIEKEKEAAEAQAQGPPKRNQFQWKASAKSS